MKRNNNNTINQSQSKSIQNNLASDHHDDELNLQVLVPVGLSSRYEDDCKIDVKIQQDQLLDNMSRSILRALDCSDTSSHALILIRDNSTIVMEGSKTLKENNIQNHDFLQFRSAKKSRRLLNNGRNHSSSDNGSDDDDDEESPDNFIEIVCTTRITDTQGNNYPPVRVRVLPSQLCKAMMDDVAILWDSRSGLKFKCGRNVLTAEKRFEDVGVEYGSEIIVTGGRN